MRVACIVVVICLILMILYLLSIMPRVFHRPDRSAFEQKLFAHRGLHNNESDAPENSMKAFAKAVAAGYGIELDVQLTKDDIPVVFHDYTLKRICDEEGKICDYTFEELQNFHLKDTEERIPLLADVLKLVNGKVPLIVEIKIEYTDTKVCALADELLQKYAGVYCVESFNPLALIWYRNHHKSIMRGQLSMVYLKDGVHHGPLFWLLQNLMLNFLTRPDFIAFDCLNSNTLSRRLCRRLYGNKMAAWTVKTQKQLEEIYGQYDVFIFDSFIPV